MPPFTGRDAGVRTPTAEVRVLPVAPRGSALVDQLEGVTRLRSGTVSVRIRPGARSISGRRSSAVERWTGKPDSVLIPHPVPGRRGWLSLIQGARVRVLPPSTSSVHGR